MFILLCQLHFLSCNQRWAKRTWKAVLYLCIQGHLEVCRWDRHFATELFTPAYAMMSYVSFKGKTVLFEVTGEHYKGRLNGMAADRQLCLPTVWVVTAGFAEVGSVHVSRGTLPSKLPQVLCVGSGSCSNANSFVYRSSASLNGRNSYSSMAGEMVLCIYHWVEVCLHMSVSVAREYERSCTWHSVCRYLPGSARSR